MQGPKAHDVDSRLIGWRSLLFFPPPVAERGEPSTTSWPTLLPVFLVVVLTGAAVVLVDRFTGPRQSVLPLYAVLVAWAAWKTGLLGGLLIAAGVSTTWLILNAVAVDVVGIWNALALFAALALLGYLAAVHRLVSTALVSVARLVSTDVLTGALNRRALAEHVEREAARCQREGAPLSLVYFDLDGFKRVNDVHGHGAGDEVLVKVVQTVSRALRAADMLARVGGDEFVALLSGVGSEDALRVAERVRAGIAETVGRDFGVTASVGLVTWYILPADHQSMIEHADHAMYLAKRNGGNQVRCVSIRRPGETLEQASHVLEEAARNSGKRRQPTELVE